MTTTHPDLAHLLAACVREPADDTARLVLADCLEENGQGERAEFIRVQVELAKCPPKHKRAGFEFTGPCDMRSHGPDYWSFTEGHECGKAGDRVDVNYRRFKGRKVVKGVRRGLLITRVTDRGSDGLEYVVKRDAASGPWKGEELAAREAALLAANPSWRPACPACAGKGQSPDARGSWAGVHGCQHCSGLGRVGTFSRGFLHSVRVPTMAAVLRQCNGLRHLWPRDTPWQEDKDCRQCKGTGWLPSLWARDLVAAHPLLAGVEVADREPSVNGFRSFAWTSADTRTGEPSYVPANVLNALPQVPGEKGCAQVSLTWAGYDSASLALSALHAAVAAVVRGLCGGAKGEGAK